MLEMSVSDGEDGMRNIKIISLYGNIRSHLNRDLSDVDIVVFDIQDVGVRFYTYLSTLHYVMESVAENGYLLCFRQDQTQMELESMERC